MAMATAGTLTGLLLALVLSRISTRVPERNR
jgi:ABC-type phosphate/phosphonate transport system permease subunit